MSDSALNAVAGAAGGIIAMTATYPLLFLSTRSAVETKESRSALHNITDILKRDGFSGLYDGLSSSLLGIALTNGVYYYFYERSREAILKNGGGRKGLTTIESMLTGLIAGSTTSILTNPIWVVQAEQATRSMQSSAQQSLSMTKPGLISAARRILEKGGIQAFWRGVGPALVLVINPILQYTVFEQLKNFLIGRRTRRLREAGTRSAMAVLSDYDYFLLGALSKLVATSSTYPYIVVKSRLQAGHLSSQKYKSALHGLITIVKEEGIGGLYKGMETKLIQSVLTAAILFAAQRRIYEITKQVISPAIKM